MTVTTRIDSPLGDLLLLSDGSALTGLYPPAHRRIPDGPVGRSTAHPVLAEAADQLAAYFAGQRTSFELPLAPRGTPFQQAVWEVLRAIPYGATLSYGEIARRLDRATEARAVGAAVGRNPISVVVPCHRVIGTSGALTGYAGGLAAKELLLALEAGRRPAGTVGAAR